MTQLTIRKCTIAELEVVPNIHALLDEYAKESALDGLPHPAVNAELYKAIEQSGVMQPFGAFIGDELVGFMQVVCSVSPKYGVVIATIESIFVLPQCRKTGAGIKLIATAKLHAQSLGAAGLVISAPIGGSLDAMLDGSKAFTPCNRIYYEALNHG